MKLYVWKMKSGKLRFTTGNATIGIADGLGTIEVEKPKKAKSTEDLKAEAMRLTKRIYDMIMANAPLDFPQPKKTVTKEAQTNGYREYSRNTSGNTAYQEHSFLIPADAKNICCTYEVDK